MNGNCFRAKNSPDMELVKLENIYKKRKLVSPNEPVNATESFMMKSVHHETGLLINILRLFRLQISK